MSWRDNLRPASFRGVPFHVEANGYSSGRRGIAYEFPKRDETIDEDLGRRVRRRIVTGYVIGPFYQIEAFALERALEREGGGLLVLPLMGQQTMRCEVFARNERNKELGSAVFEMTFVASGPAGFSLFTEATQQIVGTLADRATSAITASVARATDWL